MSIEMTSHFNFTVTQEDIDELSKKIDIIKYKATPDASNDVLRKWLDDIAEHYVESPTEQLMMIYSQSHPVARWVEVKTVHGVIRCSGEFYDVLQKHPKMLEASAREQGFPMRLYKRIVDGLGEGEVVDRSKKKQHTQPFWTNNWRKRK